MLTLTIEAAGRTHVGLVRRRNEDAFYVGEHLFAVADGLGGHVAGDVASSTVIEALKPFDRPVGTATLADTLGQAVNAASGALRRRTTAEPVLAGMGSTLVAMLCSGGRAAVANVGDSRIYLHRDGATRQITEDHTYGHLVADAGRVPLLPERLARFLDGRADGRSPDLATRDLRAGDRVLLCSDGLSSFVGHDRIHSTLSTDVSVEEAADRLVALAIEAGGQDNVTVVVVDVRAGS